MSIATFPAVRLTCTSTPVRRDGAHLVSWIALMSELTRCSPLVAVTKHSAVITRSLPILPETLGSHTCCSHENSVEVKWQAAMSPPDRLSSVTPKAGFGLVRRFVATVAFKIRENVGTAKISALSDELNRPLGREIGLWLTCPISVSVLCIICRP